MASGTTRSTVDIEARLASTESDVAHLSETLDTFSRTVVRRFDEISNQISKISDKNTITWPLIFTAIGTLVGCATLAGVIHAMSLSPLVASINRNTADLQRFYDSPGHPEMVRQTATLENDVRHIETKLTQLDEVLQREMRLLDAQGDEKIANLDDILQRETRLLLDSQKVADQEMSRRLETTEKWIVDHDSRVVDTNAQQTARLNAIEKELDRVRAEQYRRTGRVYEDDQ